MTRLATYFQLRGAGIDLVADAAGLSESDLLALGAPADDASLITALATTYFGSTTNSAKQRRAVAALRRRGHSMGTIARIEAHAVKAPDYNTAWDIRVELAATAACDIDQVATARLKKLSPPRTPTEGVRVYRRDETVLWTVSITADSDTISSIEAALDDDCSVESFTAAFFTGTAQPTVQTNVIITLDELTEIINGDGEEITLKMSNGAQITGAQLLTRTLAEAGLFTLVSPLDGPVNAYRTTRFANTKQRIMLQSRYTTCAWKDCHVPIEKCQFHHIIAWSHGGDTNIDNLVPLCAYHNGINPDDPAAPAPRGRIEIRDGIAVWCPPWTLIRTSTTPRPPPEQTTP